MFQKGVREILRYPWSWRVEAVWTLLRRMLMLDLGALEAELGLETLPKLTMAQKDTLENQDSDS